MAANTAAPVAIWTAPSRGWAAELLLLIAVVAQAFCGMASMTANSRMLYAFSRDGAVPGHSSGTASTHGRGRPRTASGSASSSPSSWRIPSLWSGVAYAAVTSIATIGLYIAYVLPTLLRRLQGKAWVGRPVVASAAGAPSSAGSGIVWVAFISVLFMLPKVGR